MRPFFSQNMTRFTYLFFQLASHVPSSTWVLAYSTFQHGMSLKTLYHRLREVETSVLSVVKDDNGFVSVEGHYYLDEVLCGARTTTDCLI